MPETIVNVNNARQYNEDYTLYALYVCRERVAADLRDGLKPVARKILLVQYEFKGKTKYPNTTKSAKIVGAVMGDYHPHGDCICGLSPLYGLNGEITTIENLYLNNIQNYWTLGVDPKSGKVIPVMAHSFRIGQYAEEIYHIKFSNGYTLSCTGNHPIMDLEGVWHAAKDITTTFIPYSVNSNRTKDGIDLSVTSIELEIFENPVPMYDFTVDEYENILLPMKMGEELSFICIHNSGIYGAMKPMTNDFEIYVPLLNGQGGWGDKFGGEPAKMRYTESGLSQFAQEYLLKDLYDSPNCVDWIPTFDDSSTEPECLPAAVPMVLIEGTFGIAVGFKVEIPKHNITEVLDATIRLLKNRDASVVLIPDHCQGCDIVNTDFETISNLGIGNYTVRGVIDTGVYNNKPALFLRSAPDLIYFQSIKEKILKLITAKKIINIVAMDDIKGQLVVTLKPGTDTNYIKQLIYQYTDMERSCRINFEVLDNKVPLRMSYKSYLLQWIEFRKFTKFRVYCNKLQTINTRIHNIEPYVKMTKSNDLDTVINLIKSKTLPEDELMEFLIKKFDLTDLQARFILNIKLKELSAHSFNQYIVEYDKLTIQRDNLMFLLTHDNSVEEEIVTELEEAKRKYGCKRHCRVISKGEAGGIPSGSFNLIITQNNFIKKIPVNEPMPVFRNDTAKFIIRGDNAENILIFSESGKVFKLAIHKIPFSDKRSNGIDIRLLLKNCSANINAIMYEPTLKEFIKKLHKYYLVALTRNGYIKKMDLDDFISANNSGLIYSKLDDGDYVKDVMIIHNTSDVVVYSTNTAIRISMEAIPYLKRATRGNRTMSSTVDGLSIVKNDTTDIIVVTKKGYVNRFSPVALLATDRISKPSKVIKLTKDDEIVAVFGLQSIDTIVVNTTSGRLDIPVVNIPVGSSVGGGTRMVQNRGDVVMSCSFIHNNQ